MGDREERERGELMAIYELILAVHENQREKGIYATTTIVNIFIFISISMEKKERKKYTTECLPTQVRLV